MDRSSKLRFKEPHHRHDGKSSGWRPYSDSYSEWKQSKRRRSSGSARDKKSGNYLNNDCDEPWDHKYKRRDAEEEFQQRLFDEMAIDESADYWDNVFSKPQRWQRKSNVDSMSEKEYTGYIRHGMWEKQHKEEIEAYKILEEERRRKKRSQQQLEDELKRQQVSRDLTREACKKREKDQAIKAARLLYKERWDTLFTRLSTYTRPITYNDIPWPCPSHTTDIIVNDLRKFFIEGQSSREDTRKTLRDARFRFHPDKFRQHFGRLFEGSQDEKRIMDTVMLISQLLNQLVEEFS